jgi:hypothetical protein
MMSDAFMNIAHPAYKTIAQQVENAIVDALVEVEPGDWRHIPNFSNRVKRLVREGDPWEYYEFDGKPLLAVGPLTSETKTDGDTVTITFKRAIRKGGDTTTKEGA